MLANMPVIGLFATVLATLLTALFVFEAFVTHLYTGPGSRWVVRILYAPDVTSNSPISRFMLQQYSSPSSFLGF